MTRLAGMREGLSPDDLDGLLERPLVAVLATYRANGDVLLSPVWHRWREGGFDVVTGGDDVKVRHLRGDPGRASSSTSTPRLVGASSSEAARCLVAPKPTSSATSLSGTSATRRAGPTRTAAMTTPSSGSSPAVYAPGNSPTTSKWRSRAGQEEPRDGRACGSNQRWLDPPG
jgi:hypothetical protein